MAEYFQALYMEHQRGLGYIFTNIILLAGMVLTLRPAKPRVPWWRVALECLAAVVVGALFTSVYYALFGDVQMDRVTLLVMICLYIALFCRKTWQISLLRGIVYFSSTIVMLPVTEPLGELVKGIRTEWFAWAQYLTPALVLVMTVAVVLFLRRFAWQKLDDVSRQIASLLLLTCVLSVGLMMMMMPEYTEVDKILRMAVAAVMWVLILATYYLCWTNYRVTTENLRLLSMKHKNELEIERYHINRMNYDELRELRHEIKNHNFYMKALADDGKWEELKDYIDQMNTHQPQALHMFDCGNYAVNVVMSHEIESARQQGVTVEASILVPPRLPLRDEEICSLLSNLMQNAAEAAAQSGVEHPTVQLSMMPRQDYLFIRVVNPVDTKAVSESRRLSMKTTKQQDRELHGYGTRIIRRIAEEHRGSVKYSIVDGCFHTDVMLELAKEDVA